MYAVTECFNVILLQIAVQFTQHYLLKRLSFLHYIFLPFLSQINWPWVHGFIAELSNLLHLSIFLFLCHNKIPRNKPTQGDKRPVL